MRYNTLLVSLCLALIYTTTIPSTDAQCVAEGQCKIGAKGKQFTTGPCQKDGECETGCCDGKKCRNPEALQQKKGETCQTGCTTSFNEQGNVGKCVLIEAKGA